MDGMTKRCSMPKLVDGWMGVWMGGGVNACIM